MKKDKRNDIRIPLIDESIGIRLENTSNFKEYGVMDISEGGLFVKVDSPRDLPKVNSYMYASFQLPGTLGYLQLPCIVSRVVWATSKAKNLTQLGFVAKFGPMRQGDKNIFDAYRSYQRNAQIIKVSRKIMEEFFGGKK
jgi:hypothetical protein